MMSLADGSCNNAPPFHCPNIPPPLAGEGQLLKRSAEKQGEGYGAGQHLDANPSGAPSP